MHEDLAFLKGLDNAALHAEGRNRSRRLAGTTWDMAVCLLAIDERRSYWGRKYTSTVQYAVMEFGLDGHRASELLRTARELQNLPLIRESFRCGDLCWSKVRELTRVVEPETEAQWLEFALAHTAERVGREVVLSPRQYKAQQAMAQAAIEQLPLQATPQAALARLPLQATTQATVEPLSLQATPQATVKQLTLQATTQAAVKELPVQASTQGAVGQATIDQVSRPLQATTQTTAEEMPPQPLQPATTAANLTPQEAATTPETSADTADTSAPASNPGPPRLANKRIRLTLDLTPDQYAIVEQALNEVHRRQGGRRPTKERAVTTICRAFLAGGSPTARLKSQVIVHTNAERDQHWYETQRGILPASEPCAAAAEAPVSQSQKFQMEQSSDNLAQPAGLQTQDSNTASKQHGVLQMQDTSGTTEQPEMFQVEQSVASKRKSGEPSGSAPCKPEGSHRRRPALPRDVVRAVRARANGRCETPGCGRGGRLHLHHVTPVSDGGQHDIDTLQLLCTACHAQHHETDFERRPEWRQAREHAVKIRVAKGDPQVDHLGQNASDPPP